MNNVLDLAHALTALTQGVLEFSDVNWMDAASKDQMESKAWLCEMLDDLAPYYGTAWLIGGWMGILPLLLLTTKGDRSERIVSIDLDERACGAADIILRKLVIANWKFIGCPCDGMRIEYRSENMNRIRADGGAQNFRISCNTVVNTSGKQFADTKTWFWLIPGRKTAIIEVNTSPDANGHISRPKNLNDLCRQTPFKRLLFSGKTPVGNHLRLMTAGYK